MLSILFWIAVSCGVQTSPAEKLYNEMRAKLAAARTLTVLVTSDMSCDAKGFPTIHSNMQLYAKKPGLVRAKLTSRFVQSDLACDGQYVYFLNRNEYTKTRGDRSKMGEGYEPGLDAFFSTETKWKLRNRDFQRLTFAGHPAFALSIFAGQEGKGTMDLIVDPRTTLPIAVRWYDPVHGIRQSDSYVGLQLNRPLSDRLFRFDLPPGAIEVKEP